MSSLSCGSKIRVRRQTWITRADLKANRDLIYVYGDNVEREGRRGLAREMRGEINAHAISVSWGPFEPFTGETLEAAKTHITDDLKALSERTALCFIWPMTGIVPDILPMPDELYAHLRQEAREILNLGDPV